MTTRTVTLRITGSSAELQKALREAGLVADSESKAIGDHVSNAADKAAGGFSRLGQSVENFTGIPVGAFTDHVSEKFKNLETSGQKLNSTLSTIGGVTLAAGAVGFAAVAGEAVKMGTDLQESQHKLDTAIKAAGESPKAYQSALDATRSKLEALGFTNAQVNDALAQGVVSTQSTSKAISQLGLAADLARFKHIDLTTAELMLNKALEGNSRVLKQLGIDLPVPAANALKLKTAQDAVTTAVHASNDIVTKYGQSVMDAGNKHNPLYEASLTKVEAAQKKLKELQNAHIEILDALSKRLKGQAADSAQTFSGRMQVLRAQTQDLGAKFGEFLIPKLELLMSTVSKVIGWFEKHKAVAEALGAVIGGALAIAVAVFAVNTGVKMVKSVQEATKAISSLAQKIPEFISGLGGAGAAEEEFAATSETTGEAASTAFGPVGIAIMAIVAVGTLVATHWSQVKRILDTVWNGIKGTAVTVWDFIKNHLGIVIPIIATLMTGPIGGAVALIATHWKTIKSDAVAAWNGIVNFFTGIPGKVVGAISSLGSNIAGVATKAWDAFKGAVVTGWNSEVSFWTSLPGKIVSALGDAAKVLFNWGKDLIKGIVKGIESAASDIGKALEGAIKSGWNSVKGAINSIPLIGGALSHIPGLATGGFVTKPTLALVAEAGPEFVIPASQMQAAFAAGVQPLPTTLFSGPGPASGTPAPLAGAVAAGASSSTVVNQNFYMTTPALPTDVAHSVGIAMRLAGIS